MHTVRCTVILLLALIVIARPRYDGLQSSGGSTTERLPRRQLFQLFVDDFSRLLDPCRSVTMPGSHARRRGGDDPNALHFVYKGRLDFARSEADAENAFGISLFARGPRHDAKNPIGFLRWDDRHPMM